MKARDPKPWRPSLCEAAEAILMFLYLAVGVAAALVTLWLLGTRLYLGPELGAGPAAHPSPLVRLYVTACVYGTERRTCEWGSDARYSEAPP